MTDKESERNKHIEKLMDEINRNPELGKEIHDQIVSDPAGFIDMVKEAHQGNVCPKCGLFSCRCGK